MTTIKSFMVIVIGSFLLTSCAGLDKGSFLMVRSLNTKSYGYQIVDDHTGSAPTEKIERFEVRPGDCSSENGWSDCANDRERSELKEPVDRRYTRSGSEYWYGWSVYFPTDFPNVYPTKVCVGQFHQSKGHVIWMTQINESGLHWDDQVYGRTNTYYKLLDIKELRGKWHTFEMYIKWSKDARYEDGIMKIWVNDELKLDLKGENCRNKDIYFKYGIYRSFMSRYKNINDVDEVPAQIVYYSNVKRSKTREGLKAN